MAKEESQTIGLQAKRAQREWCAGNVGCVGGALLTPVEAAIRIMGTTPNSDSARERSS